METTIFKDLQLSTEMYDAVQLSTFTESTYEKKGKITVDDEMSTTSENPVQNKVISKKIKEDETRILALEKAGERIGALEVGTDLASLIETVKKIRDIFKGEWRLIIQTPQELMDFAEAVNNGDDFYDHVNNKPYTVILANNIDMEGYECQGAGFYSRPGVSGKREFDGIFEGQGYKIKNMTIVAENGQKGVGFVGQLGSHGIVRNLVLQDSTIRAYGRYVGSFVGHSGTSYNEKPYGGALIQNCQAINVTVENNSSDTNMIGGIGGHISGLIVGCKFNGSITANDTGTGTMYVGGIVGNKAYVSTQDCESQGLIHIVKSSQKYGPSAGGISGYQAVVEDNSANSGIVNCKSDMEIVVDDRPNYVAPIAGSYGDYWEQFFGLEVDPCVNALINKFSYGNTWTDRASPSDKYEIFYVEKSPMDTPTGMFIWKDNAPQVGLQSLPATSQDGQIAINAITELDGSEVVKFFDTESTKTVKVTGRGLSKIHTKCYWNERKPANQIFYSGDVNVTNDNEAIVTINKTDKFTEQWRPGNRYASTDYPALNFVYNDIETIECKFNAEYHGHLTDATVSVEAISGRKVSVKYTKGSAKVNLSLNKDYEIEYSEIPETPDKMLAIINGIDLFEGRVEKTFTPKA